VGVSFYRIAPESRRAVNPLARWVAFAPGVKFQKNRANMLSQDAEMGVSCGSLGRRTVLFWCMIDFGWFFCTSSVHLLGAAAGCNLEFLLMH
jgi:hypothetical protein